MDKYFWANFISFAMSGTLSEKHYKDLNSVDSFIKSVGDSYVSVFSMSVYSVWYTHVQRINYC